jgi:hypothetical protein
LYRVENFHFMKHCSKPSMQASKGLKGIPWCQPTLPRPGSMYAEGCLTRLLAFSWREGRAGRGRRRPPPFPRILVYSLRICDPHRHDATVPGSCVRQLSGSPVRQATSPVQQPPFSPPEYLEESNAAVSPSCPQALKPLEHPMAPACRYASSTVAFATS